MDTTKQIDTPYNNAAQIFNKANSLLLENNILDSTGTETAQLEQNPANPAWLFALACGSLHTSWQEQIAKAYSALDPQNCEEGQVLVLASIAGLERGNGKPSHITLLLENTSETQVVIPARTEFKETYANQSWFSNMAVTLAPKGNEGYTKNVAVFSAVDGAFEIPIGVDFTSDDYSDVTCTSTSASALGEDIEPISDLRNRLSQGAETSDYKTQCKNAIEKLPGVDSCAIWFNNSVVDDMVIGNAPNEKTIPPRNAYVSIKGVDIDKKMAETYYSYLDCPATVGTNESVCQVGMQNLTMKYDTASEKTINITVAIDSFNMAVGASDAIKEKISSFSGTLSCGENLTAQQVSEWLTNLGYGTIIGVEVDGGMSSDIGPDEYCVFDANSITVNAI